MKKVLVLSLLVASVVFFAPSFANVAHANPVTPNETSTSHGILAPAKKTLKIRVVFCVGSSYWVSREISDAYNRVTLAVNYWNSQPIPYQFQIAELNAAALGFDSLNTERAVALANSLSRDMITVYLVRDPWMWYSLGFAVKGHYAVVAYTSTMSSILGHELGHVLGANDRYATGGNSSTCTGELDLMCRPSLAGAPSTQTLSEINNSGL
jgi:hypothetical protein